MSHGTRVPSFNKPDAAEVSDRQAPEGSALLGAHPGDYFTLLSSHPAGGVCSQQGGTFRGLPAAYLSSVRRHVIETKKMIADLFKKNSAMIDNLLQAIVKIVDRERARLGDPIEMDGIMCSLHFTETNRLRFRKIYKKWWCLFPNKSLVDRAQKASSAQDLMQSMELDIASEAQSWKLK